MQSAIRGLKQLGFSDYEARAYAVLVGESPLTAYEMAKHSGIPSSKIYEVIRKLEFRHMIQSIHGERSKMFVPLSPDEFVSNFRSTVEGSLDAVRRELKGSGPGPEISYTWHMKDYESVLLKAKRMVSTSRQTLLLMVWPQEMEQLEEDLRAARKRGISITAVHFGPITVRLGRVYVHPRKGTIYEKRNVRALTLVSDSREALNAKIGAGESEGMWSMNESFVIMAEDYIRHDIYQMDMVHQVRLRED